MRKAHLSGGSTQLATPTEFDEINELREVDKANYESLLQAGISSETYLWMVTGLSTPKPGDRPPAQVGSGVPVTFQTRCFGLSSPAIVIILL